MSKTLIEKMKARGDIPKSWLAELRTMENKLKAAEARAEEYGLIIDRLAPIKEAIIEERTKIESDERYHYPSANVVINAPLALIQTAMESQMRVLNRLSPPTQDDE